VFTFDQKYEAKKKQNKLDWYVVWQDKHKAMPTIFLILKRV